MNIFIEFFVVPIVAIGGGYIVYRRLTINGRRVKTVRMSQHKTTRATSDAIVEYVNEEPSSPGTTISGRLPK